MKKTYVFVFLIFALLKNQSILGQYLQIAHPIYQGVYQRDGSDNANIPVSGQVFGFPTSTPGTYKIECITNRLDQFGVVIAGTSNTTLITFNTSKGYFNGSISRSKGWYSLQVKYTFNSTGYTSSSSSKFGVGDVFIIAGQSNGQGDIGSALVSTDFPEWIVGNNEDWSCRKEFENSPSMTKISGSINHTNKIGPAGYNSWCYGVLGKKISDANGQNLPIAFFNTCSGGSSVKNWSDGADGIGTTGSRNGLVEPSPGVVVAKRWCAGDVSGQPIFIPNTNPAIPNPYYDGQPYTQLKNVLNWYVPLFGVRAVLWIQGEADADATATYTSNLSRTGNNYYTNLKNVIDKSREHSAINNLSWVVAETTYNIHNTQGRTFTNNATFTPTAPNIVAGDYALNVRKRQSNNSTNTLDIGVVGLGATIRGPLTDRYNNASTGGYRYDNTHFTEGSVGGLTLLGTLWNNVIDPSPSSSSITAFNRIPAKPVPTISISQSGSTYTCSVTPVTGAEYCWTLGNKLAPPQVANTANCLGISSSIPITNGSTVRCFIGTKNSNNTATNWVSTGVVGPQNCPGCREAAEEPDETYGGINMKVYPNPTDKDFRVEFDVLEDDTHVKLEVFDVSGRSVKVIADGSHAKGHFNYPITETLPTGLIICQLKVGDIYISHKISKVN